MKSANFFSYPGGVFINSFLPASEIWVFQKQFLARLYSHPERNITSIKPPQIASLSNEVLGRIPHASLLEPAVTNARFASLHGLPVAPSPSRRRPFHFTNRALVTSLHGAGLHEQRASVCGSAAGVALGLRFTRRSSPLSALRSTSPLADRRPKPQFDFPRAIRRS